MSVLTTYAGVTSAAPAVHSCKLSNSFLSVGVICTVAGGNVGSGAIDVTFDGGVTWFTSSATFANFGANTSQQMTLNGHPFSGVNGIRLRPTAAGYTYTLQVNEFLWPTQTLQIGT